MTIQYLVDEQIKVCGDESSESFYKLIAEKVPDRIIYESLSEAKADNQLNTKPSKLYTTIITREAQKYLNRYLKKSQPEPN